MHSIILCTFAYKFISNLHYLDEIASNSPSVIKRRLTASDCPEGNRRDCNMSGNQTSGEEGGVQCVMMGVCMYVCIYA